MNRVFDNSVMRFKGGFLFNGCYACSGANIRKIIIINRNAETKVTACFLKATAGLTCGDITF